MIKNSMLLGSVMNCLVITSTLACEDNNALSMSKKLPSPSVKTQNKKNTKLSEVLEESSDEDLSVSPCLIPYPIENFVLVNPPKELPMSKERIAYYEARRKENMTAERKREPAILPSKSGDQGYLSVDSE